MELLTKVGAGLLTIAVAAVVASVVLPRNHMMNPIRDPMEMIGGTRGSADIVEVANENKIPLFVYVGGPVTSRKWSSFYDRRHADHRSPLITMIETTHTAHHTMGPVRVIDDEYLMRILRKVCSEEAIRTVAGDRGAISLQHDRMLRDALLMYVVCEHGGILIPQNAMFLQNTGILWDSITRRPENTVLVSSGSANDDYGCPMIITKGGKSCKKVVANTLLGAGVMREFYGGVTFGGGSSVVLKRLKDSGLPIHEIHGIARVRADELGEMKPLRSDLKHSVVVLIPFPQGTGTTSIARRDEWLYSESPEGLLKNPILLRDLFIQSSRNSKGKM